jgi:hypothetical protein
MQEAHQLKEQMTKDKSNHDKELQKTKSAAKKTKYDAKKKIAEITDKAKYDKKSQYDAQSFVAEYLELKIKSSSQ